MGMADYFDGEFNDMDQTFGLQNRRVMLVPDVVADSLALDQDELAAETGMLIIVGPKELLDQIRVL